ncbi:MAG: DUF3604 domain-containing protein [Myxococcales bacterium]|nr:DUF3604 domain-containing protein [Myxococcales bacterium]
MHSSYSWDGFMFTLPLAGGEGAHPPADACDFARHCSNLDFFALTDHAETLLPEHWEASKESLRQCNARAGDPADPDLVAFTGFEWSQAGTTPEEHFGHRCLIFAGSEEDELPARAIGAGAKRTVQEDLRGMMRGVRYLQPQAFGAYTSFADYLGALLERPVCDPGVDSRELPPDCEEVAPTPAELHEKLDQWGVPVLEIPHGTTWGTYTPIGSDIARHLDAEVHDPERQRLIEIMSGHGNSEVFRPWRPVTIDEAGNRVCPEPTADYLPCCWQAGEIMRKRCGDLPEDVCEERVALAREYAARADIRPHQVFPDAPMEDWLDCNQCRDCAKPSFGYRPRESVQYAMALSRDGEGADAGPQRFRYGFVASSDGHTGRPGTGYKQIERSMMTDGVAAPGLVVRKLQERRRRMDTPDMPLEPARRQVGILGSDMRVQSFLYPGGLAAVHADGRSREEIWQAFQRREVYGTSGPRILLWFDLLNGGDAPLPMGSEVRMNHAPRFRVRAIGSFEPKPGCPAWAGAGLAPERMERLCRGECHHPSDVRRGIRAIEVIRIRPQRHAGEDVAPLIEDPWRRFECGDDPRGCTIEFSDEGFASSGRDALYYVRALEVPSLAINAANLQTGFDAEGRALSITPCHGEGREDGCPAPIEERAWSSPIFVDRL